MSSNMEWLPLGLFLLKGFREIRKMRILEVKSSKSYCLISILSPPISCLKAFVKNSFC